tara:strand:+ start:8249 stop:9694 length:1446 start_codon:yes stop_codon:yes gene_type:complete
MIILVGSKIDQISIQGSLGKPEYSYFFLLKDFLPALEQMGRVIMVRSAEEVESLYAQHSSAGEEVVFLSFSPPHQAPLGLACPTVVVFAWEFDTLPTVAWDGIQQNDWRYALAQLQGAICTSTETSTLVAQATLPGFPVAAMPAAIWDRYAPLGLDNGIAVSLKERRFLFSGVVIDSPLLGLSADGLVRKPGPVEPLESSVTAPGALNQFWFLTKALLAGWLKEIRKPMASSHGVGEQGSQSAPVATEPSARPLSVSGVVYTTVLNPADGRKNWVDLVTAFCWAFKDTEDATLILKMTHHSLEHYRVVLMTLLSRLAPFRCRVLVLHGFLEDGQYHDLIKASTYYVNASSCEGLCLPLMEFLASGRPAIAPNHSAMADYLSADMAFLLKTSLEPSCWPHDPTGMLYTHRHRLNWESLMDAYRASYKLAKEDPARYQTMSSNGYRQMRSFASIKAVSALLKDFLPLVQRTGTQRHVEEYPAT